MTLIKKIPGTDEKLNILSRDSRYDLACACATRDDEHRRRSKDDTWIYPVSLPHGGTTFIFKTLLSNACINDCYYCPLRAAMETQRCALSPEELSKTFFAYYKARRVSGLFLSSAVTGNPDSTMERMNRSALMLRRMQFRGYIHLKIIPGASDAAIRQSLALANAVSLNIETSGEDNFRYLSTTKDYLNDIIRPTQLISRLTARGFAYHGVKQTTQFVVGASQETDREIVYHSWKLYKELHLSRVYFSAYQRGNGSRNLPGEHSGYTNSQMLAREHRLYQADWLMRKYRFKAEEIPFETDGNLSLETDPKEMWAMIHPEFFPVNINKADAYSMLRIPGIGHIALGWIFDFRKNGIKIRTLNDLGKRTKILKKAEKYVTF